MAKEQKQEKQEQKAQAQLIKVSDVEQMKSIILTGSPVLQLEMSTKYNSKTENACKLKADFDYTGISLYDILQWASYERRIAFQRGLRSIESEEQFLAFHDCDSEGKQAVVPTVHVPAGEAGKKPSAPKTPEQIQAEAMGLVAQLSPEQKAALREMLDSQK